MAGNYIGANSEWHEADLIPSNYGIPMTMVVCYRVAATTNAEYLFWMGDKDTTSSMLAIGLQSDGTITGSVRSSSASAFLDTGTASYSANTWEYIGLDTTASNDHNLWFNGAFDIQDTTDITALDTFDRTAIGHWADSTPTSGTNVDIAWAAMWGVVLSANEHAALAAGVDPKTIQPNNLGDFWEILNVSGRSLVRGCKGLNLVENGSVNYIGDHPPIAKFNRPVLVSPLAASLSLEQEGYRWRDDDGTEATATWLAAQDTDINLSTEQTVRLRVLVNATGDPPAGAVQLEVKKTSEADTAYTKIT